MSQFPKPNLRGANPQQRLWWSSHTKYQLDKGSIFPYTCPLCGEQKEGARYIPTSVWSAYGASGDPICPSCYENPPVKEKKKRKIRELPD